MTDLVLNRQSALTPAQFGQLADVPCASERLRRAGAGFRTGSNAFRRRAVWSRSPDAGAPLPDPLRPPEIEWLANITNPKTRRAYKNDVSEFFSFVGLKESVNLRNVVRAHVIAWRKDLEARELADSSIPRKLSALSSLFDYLCERNAVLGNPVDGIKRPAANNNEGSTPALGDAQARKLLDAPPEDTLKVNVIAPFLRRCSITGFAEKSFPRYESATCKRVKVSCTFASKARTTRFVLFRSTLRRYGLSKTTCR